MPDKSLESDSPRTIKPELIFVRVDTTQHWVPDFLTKYSIKRICNIYLYDYRSHTHCCEITPSYSLHHCTYTVEHVEGFDDEEIIEEADGEVMVACSEDEAVIYMHVSAVDNIPDEDKDKKNPLTDDCEWESAEEYNQLIEDWIESYRGNPTL